PTRRCPMAPGCDPAAEHGSRNGTTRMEDGERTTMNSKRHYLTEAILNRLRATWTDAVAAGLRGASEVELLWLLDEIEAQLGQRTVAWSSPTAPPDEWDDIPDWDDKTPEELDAIARDLEDQLGADEGDAAMSLHGAEGPRPRCLPLRR